MILRNIPREDDIWVRFLKMGRSCSIREEKKGGFFLIREIAQYMTRWTNCLSQRKPVPEGRVAIHGLCINVRQFLPKRAHPSTSMCIFFMGQQKIFRILLDLVSWTYINITVPRLLYPMEWPDFESMLTLGYQIKPWPLCNILRAGCFSMGLPWSNYLSGIRVNWKAVLNNRMDWGVGMVGKDTR